MCSSTQRGHLSRRRSVQPEDGNDAPSGPSPEAWREFRAQLISGGLKLTTDMEEGQKEDSGSADVPPPAPDAVAASTGQARGRPRVAPKNEELLREQNEALWNEYINGAWAHESPMEAGGLLCRLPLQAQLINEMRRGDEGSRWGLKLRERLTAELPAPEEGRSKEDIFAVWSQNNNYCYRLAEAVISETLQGIAEKAKDRRIDPRRLNAEERDLIVMYSQDQDSWQAVCLVLSVATSSSSEAAEAVVINRPFAKGINPELAELLLNGRGQSQDEAPPLPAYDDEVVSRCVRAFGKEAAVYVGGPDLQSDAGLLVHGYESLPGAQELAPGTRIYIGGVVAAIDGVLAGEFSPLDFRWFVGRHSGLSTARGEWRAMACARPIALKQCLGLPKPLWHEIMELCGGESAELSRLEFVKRDDLEDDEEDDGADEAVLGLSDT